MTVVATKSIAQCKLCSHPRRDEIDAVLEKRSTRARDEEGPWDIHRVLAFLAEIGVQNPNKENCTLHFKRHCEVVDDRRAEERGALLHRACQELALWMDDREPDPDTVLDAGMRVAWLTWKRDLSEGRLPKMTPDQIRQFVDSKTKRKSAEKVDRLMDLSAEALTAGLGLYEGEIVESEVVEEIEERVGSK